MKNIFSNFFRQRQALWVLAKNQIKSRFAGTAGGIFWALAQPFATIIIYYFVFTVVFRAQGLRALSFCSLVCLWACAMVLF